MCAANSVPNAAFSAACSSCWNRNQCPCSWGKHDHHHITIMLTTTTTPTTTAQQTRLHPPHNHTLPTPGQTYMRRRRVVRHDEVTEPTLPFLNRGWPVLWSELKNVHQVVESGFRRRVRTHCKHRNAFGLLQQCIGRFPRHHEGRDDNVLGKVITCATTNHQPPPPLTMLVTTPQ